MSHETLHLPDDTTTIAAVKAYLAMRSEAWSLALAQPRVRAALDQKLASDDSVVRDGAELAFFPPVTGG